MGIFIRKQIKRRAIKLPVAVLVCALLVVGGGITAYKAVAVANGNTVITPASGGSNVSIDTTSAGGTEIYTQLSGPAITENSPEDIAAGTHTISLPSGWEFNVGSPIIIVPAGDITLGSNSVIPNLTDFSFTVSDVSTEKSALVFTGLEVRPTNTTVGTGNMLYSGDGIDGVVGSTNFGTLTTVAGEVTQVAFTTQPGDAVYGSDLDPQPVVKTQDQFGNDSINGLGDNNNVVLTLTGTGVLIGTATLDIGTSAGNGIITFTDLIINAVGTKQLTAEATGFESAVSGSFEITLKTLTATITADSKTYDGNNSATFTSPTPVGVEFSDILTLSGGSATFADADVGTDKIVTVTGLALTGDNSGNYSYDGTAVGSADISPLEIIVTPDADQAKVYGNTDPIFAYTFDPALISPDTFSGALSRVEGEDVDTYAYTIGILSAGGNYTLTLVSGTFEIIKRDITVLATGVNREYDRTTNATVILSSSDEVLGDNLVYTYGNAFFLDKIAGYAKQVDVTGISISGSKAGNYNLLNTEAQTTADITKKPITLTINVSNKTYNGNTDAAYSSTNPRVLNGVIVNDVVVANNDGLKAFEDKHVGVDKNVNASGVSLSGDDKDNYDFNGNGAGIATINIRPITVTAVTDSRTYNGTMLSAGEPTIENTGSLTSGPIMGTDVANFAQTYDNKNVGTGKTLTPSGVVNDGNSGNNYDITFKTDITGEITQKSINVTAQTDTRAYNGTTNSSVSPLVDELASTDSIETAPTQAFDTKDVGNDKILTASGLVITGGNDNYNITYIDAAGEITEKELTVIGATTISKTYDGDETATVNFTSPGLVGVIGGENITLNSSSYSATFDNKNVGVTKTVTVLGLTLAGTGTNNYLLTQPTLNDGEITQRTLVVTADGINKVYDANTTATVILLDDRVLEDDITLGYTASFSDKNVGNGKSVSVTGISIIGGSDAGNYILDNTTAATTANITHKPLTATITVADKVYDGNTSATITEHILDGIAGNDEVIPSGGIAIFADASVGTGKAVSATGIIISGADIGNYSYNGEATGTGNILPIPTTVFVDDDFTAGSAGGYTFGYNAFNTIQAGINAVDISGTVDVAEGTYYEVGQIVIDKNLAIVGADKTTTIIKPNHDTTVAGYVQSDAWVYVPSGITFALSNVTLDGTDLSANLRTIRHAIQSRGELIVEDCIIKNIKAAKYYGRGIVLLAGTSNTITRCEFSDIQRIGIHVRGSVESTDPVAYIKDCTYTGKGIGDWLDYGIEFGGGGSGTVDGCNISACTGVASVDGSTSAGILATDYYGTGTIVTVENSTLTDNTAGIAVGYAAEDATKLTAHQNIFSGNTYGIENVGVTEVDATANWWGTYVESEIQNIISGSVDYSPWYMDEDMTTLSDSIDLTVVYVDDNYNAESCADYYWNFNCFDTIQEGIDAVQGSTVNVAAGTYNENVEIRKTLTLLGEGADVTTIEPSSGRVINIRAQEAINGFIDGLTIQGFTLRTNDNNIALQSNSANDDKYNGRNYSYKDLIVDANNNVQTAIGLFDVDGVVLDNVVVKNSARTDGGAIEMVGVKDFMMENSELTNNALGLKVFDAAGYMPNQNITVIHSRITGNNIGIINSVSGLTLNAKANWWGDDSGSAHTSNTGGTGDSVSDNVDFRPWYTEVGMAILDETQPDVTIASIAFPLTNTSPIPVIVEFTEAVTNFEVGDIVVTNGTAGDFDGSGDSYSFNITPTLVEGAIKVDIAADVAWDLAGNYNTVADQFSIDYDSVLPTLTSVSIASNNTNTSLAKVGDTVTLNFASSEEIQEPTVTIAGNIVDATDEGLNNWTAVYTMLEGDINGIIAFTIDFTDLAGNNGMQVIATTDTTSVIFDKTAPNTSLTIDPATPNGENNWYITAPTLTLDCEDQVNLSGCDGIYYRWGDSGDFSVYQAPLTASEGTHTLYYYSTDNAGNQEETKISAELKIDTINPEVTLLSTFLGQTLIGGTNPSINWTANDSNFGITPIKLEYSVNGGSNWTVIVENTENNTGSLGYANYAWTVPNNINSSACHIRVTAVDLAGNTEMQQNATPFAISNTVTIPDPICTELQDGQWTCDISLNQGWNLISSPVVVNSNIASILSDISTNVNIVWYYESNTWYFYDPANTSGNTLSTMEDGEGYWVYMKNADILTLTGLANPVMSDPPSTPSSYNVNLSDWNLIGFRSVNDMVVDNYVKNYINDSLNKDYIIWKYENGISLEHLNKESEMKPGYGYWLYME